MTIAVEFPAETSEVSVDFSIDHGHVFAVVEFDGDTFEALDAGSAFLAGDTLSAVDTGWALDAGLDEEKKGNLMI